jgi:hypothetical protein
MTTTTAFISRRLDIHPSSVPAVVAEWHRSLPAVTAVRGFVRLGPRLWLADAPEGGGCDPFQMYVVPGVLWLWGRPVRVHLEFSMWSNSDSQLSLRPAHLAWPVRTEGYALRARSVLDDVVDALAAPVVCRPERQPATVTIMSVGTPVRSVA